MRSKQISFVESLNVKDTGYYLRSPLVCLVRHKLGELSMNLAPRCFQIAFNLSHSIDVAIPNLLTIVQ